MTERRRIAVAVTLYDDPTAGGHVKVWQRWGEAIAKRRDPIDLTLFFLGDQEEVVPLSDHVRCHRLPPVKGTRQRPWLQNGGGDTDLAKAHPLLAERAADRQVLHATDTFSFGQTFKHLAQSNGAVFLAGMQSDLERLTPVYAREIIARMLGSTPTSILFTSALDICWPVRHVLRR